MQQSQKKLAADCTLWWYSQDSFLLQSLQTVTTNTCETEIPCSSFTSVAFERQSDDLFDFKRFSVLRRLVKSVTPKIETFYWSDFTALYFLVEITKISETVREEQLVLFKTERSHFLTSHSITILQILQQSQIKSWVLIVNFGGIAQSHPCFSHYKQLRRTLVKQKYPVQVLLPLLSKGKAMI